MKTTLILLGMCIGYLAVATGKDTAVKTEIVEYRAGTLSMRGYVAYPAETEGRRPGILVFSEWKGLNDYARQRADQLAGMGYVALAADMYGDGRVAKDNAQAAEWAGALKASDRSEMGRRASAALEALKQHARVDPSRVGAIGYCFGGTVALELARSGADVDGVVSFHGALDTPHPAEHGRIRAAVLVCHGADDPHVPQATVVAFQEEMSKAGADWQMISYGGAVHSFTNPSAGSDSSTGVAYNERADRRSWDLMRSFFAGLFGP